MKACLGSTASVVVVLAVLAGVARGQRATEQYIPLGKSPGISGEYARMGTIDAFDPESRTLTISTDDGPVIAQLTDDTKIWIDVSHLGESNAAGDVDDLVEGREVEMLSVDHERRGGGPADWIKVRRPR